MTRGSVLEACVWRAVGTSMTRGSVFEACVWRAVGSDSPHHPQVVILAYFYCTCIACSLCVKMSLDIVFCMTNIKYFSRLQMRF